MRNILPFKDFLLLEGEENSNKSSLFDLDNKLVYQTLKDIRTATINGKEYTFMCIGSGMAGYAESVSKQNENLGKILSKIAENKDKVLVFSPDGIYVISEAVSNGIMSLAFSIFSYVKEMSITAGSSIVYGFKRINSYFEKNGESPFNQMKQDPTGIFNTILTDLYKLAEDSSKASEAISVLVVGGYKSSTSSFKTIPNFLENCLYKVAKDLGIRSVNVGQNIEDFYKVAQNTLNNLGVPITKTIDSGLEKLSSMVEKGIRKSEIFATRLKKESAEALKSAQDRIAPTGKMIVSKSKPVWDSIFGKKRSN